MLNPGIVVVDPLFVISTVVVTKLLLAIALTTDKFIGTWPDWCCLLNGFRSVLCCSVRLSLGAMTPLLSTSNSCDSGPGVGVDETAI